MAPGTLADEIRQRLGELSPAERKVGRVLLAGYPAAGFETVAVLAERAGVSAPTVLRFATRLGYSGFPALQSALRAELEARNAWPLTLYDRDAYERGPAGDDGEGLLRHGSDIFASAVGRTLAELPPHDLDRTVEYLSDPKRRITVAGGRFTHLLAQYLALHLMQLRDGVHILPDRPVERTAALTACGRRDVLVLFDYRRYEQDKSVIAETLREKGGTVVLFTDAWLSPATVHADVVLASQVTAPSPYDSLVPTLAVVETTVAAVVNALGEKARTRMRQGEDTAVRHGLNA